MSNEQPANQQPSFIESHIASVKNPTLRRDAFRCYHPPPMSMFTRVPDDYFQPSRFEEQQAALERPVQYSLQTLMVILTGAAVTFGAIHAAIKQVNEEHRKQVGTAGK